MLVALTTSCRVGSLSAALPLALRPRSAPALGLSEEPRALNAGAGSGRSMPTAGSAGFGAAVERNAVEVEGCSGAGALAGAAVVLAAVGCGVVFAAPFEDVEPTLAPVAEPFSSAVLVAADLLSAAPLDAARAGVAGTGCSVEPRNTSSSNETGIFGVDGLAEPRNAALGAGSAAGAGCCSSTLVSASGSPPSASACCSSGASAGISSWTTGSAATGCCNA